METIDVIAECPASPGADLVLSREFRAMGSRMTALLESDSPPANDLLSAVPAWFECWEQALSRFRADSELSLLNQRSGRPVGVSADLLDVLGHALWQARQTGGLVTPLVLDALAAAGYDRTFEALAALAPNGDATPSRGPVANWREIRLDAGKQTVLVPRGARLDLGGVAKGWAADRAAARLARLGPALVDAGGDIAVSGPMLDGAGWTVGVADPTAPNQYLEILSVRSGGVATSGRDYRRWRRNGLELHHIIDPRSGRPAQTDVLSATVVGPSTVAAEAAAKTALILGSRAGLAWLEARPDLAGLLVLDNGRTVRSHNLGRFISN